MDRTAEKASTRRHKNISSYDKKPFVCAECDERYRTYHDLISHKKTCQQIFALKELQSCQGNEASTKSHTCAECGDRFSEYKELMVHRKWCRKQIENNERVLLELSSHRCSGANVLDRFKSFRDQRKLGEGEGQRSNVFTVRDDHVFQCAKCAERFQ